MTADPEVLMVGGLAVIVVAYNEVKTTGKPSIKAMLGGALFLIILQGLGQVEPEFAMALAVVFLLGAVFNSTLSKPKKG